jgi:plasmid stabilization system protein ParE
MEIRWSPLAVEDLERICERIQQDNPEAAGRVARTIYEGCASLTDFPYRGRPILVPRANELLISWDVRGPQGFTLTGLRSLASLS